MVEEMAIAQTPKPTITPLIPRKWFPTYTAPKPKTTTKVSRKNITKNLTKNLTKKPTISILHICSIRSNSSKNTDLLYFNKLILVQTLPV
jgi:hypothetical protein